MPRDVSHPAARVPARASVDHFHSLSARTSSFTHLCEKLFLRSNHTYSNTRGREPPAGKNLGSLVFRCQICCQQVPPRTTAQRVIVQTRPQKYPARSKANRVVRLSETGKPKVIFVDDPGGVGREIVRELMVCPGCASAHNRS
jgi:hypothetical protein